MILKTGGPMRVIGGNPDDLVDDYRSGKRDGLS
jgi:hypothetical protein